MRKALIPLIVLIGLIVFSILQQVPEYITVKLNDEEITLHDGEVYETFVEGPTDPILEYAFKSQLKETIVTKNIEGVFTYTITIKNWINKTATFTIREHIKLNEALLIIDLQNYYNDYPQIATVVNRVNRLIDKAHRNHVPVIFLKNQQILNDHGITAWEIQDALDKDPYDYLLPHEFGNGFQDTGLEEILRYNDIHKLYIAGVGSFGSVNQTARAALALNYQVVIVSDAHTDLSVSRDITINIINKAFESKENSIIMLTEEIIFQR
jgi:nicotinamidase-related amidase